MVGHHIGLNQMHPLRSSCLNLSVIDSNGLTDCWRFLPSNMLDRNSVLFLLNCIDSPVMAFPNFGPKCLDSSVWTDQKVHMVPSGPTLGFPLNLPPLDFHRWVILVYHSVYKKQNKKNFLFEIEWVTLELPRVTNCVKHGGPG